MEASVSDERSYGENSNQHFAVLIGGKCAKTHIWCWQPPLLRKEEKRVLTIVVYATT